MLRPDCDTTKVEDISEKGYAVVYFFVDDIEETLRKAVECGGKQTLERTAQGEHGWYADFRDSEGNFHGLFSVNAKKE